MFVLIPVMYKWRFTRIFITNAAYFWICVKQLEFESTGIFICHCFDTKNVKYKLSKGTRQGME